MKRKILLSILIIGIALAFSMVNSGCNSNQNEQQSRLSTSINNSDSLEGMSETIYRGVFNMSHEADYFVECTSKEMWRVTSENEDALRQQYDAIAQKPYADIYAELKGYTEPLPSNLPGAEDFSQLFVVQEIIILDDLDNGNDCTRGVQVN